MLEPSYMSLPKASALPILEMGFSATAKRRLLENGIASALQLAEIASRNPSQLRHLTGVTGTRARRQLEVELGILPDFTNMAVSFNPLPAAGVPLKGITRTSVLKSETRLPSLPKRVEDHLDGLAQLPTAISLVDQMQPVGDQGQWGTCVGWAANAMQEYHLQRPMSPGYAYRGAKRLDGFPGEGSWLHYAMEHQFAVGHVSEADYSYQAAIRNDPIDDLAEIAFDARSGGWALVDIAKSTVALPKLMRSVLAGRLNPAIGKQPIAVGLVLYPSFTSTSTALDGLIPMPLPDETGYGGHAMCVVGYVDKSDASNPFGISYFTTRNSWGTTWAGENPLSAPGHAMIPEAYFANRKNIIEAIILLKGAA